MWWSCTFHCVGFGGPSGPSGSEKPPGSEDRAAGRGVALPSAGVLDGTAGAGWVAASAMVGCGAAGAVAVGCGVAVAVVTAAGGSAAATDATAGGAGGGAV